ncbi:MAG: glycosyltransferase family 9 protein [Nitrospirae bacterium]|nr:glycosyltransferase family 9 protein [Nitrospirota bacterium]
MKKRIIALPLYGIGDVLMSTPAVRNLKEQLDCEITYLHMFRTTHDILLNNPYIKQNIFFPFLTSSRLEGIRFLLQFRGKFDCSINFYPSNRSDYNLAAYLIGSPLRIGHRYVVRDLVEMNFLKNRTVVEDDTLHNVEENLRLLDFLGINAKEAYPLDFFPTEEERYFAREWIKGKGIESRMLVGIHPGASAFKNHSRKKWPETSFASLINMLSSELRDCAFLLFGGAEERDIRQQVVAFVNDTKKVVPVDFVSVRQAASLIMKCSLFISNDSGPMHMAAAVRVPTVAIFGPTNPQWVRPWGVPHRVVRACESCNPCFRYSPIPMRCVTGRDFACLREISGEQVYETCLDLLREEA